MRIGLQSRARQEAGFWLFRNELRFLTGAALIPQLEPRLKFHRDLDSRDRLTRFQLRPEIET